MTLASEKTLLAIQTLIEALADVAPATAGATEATLAAASAKLPASLGAKAGAYSLSVVPATDAALGQLPASLGAKAGTASLSVVPATDSGLATAANQLLLTCAQNLSVITPSDTTDTSALTTKGLQVLVGGTLAVRGIGSVTTASFTVTDGIYIPVNVSRVMVATTATLIGLS